MAKVSLTVTVDIEVPEWVSPELVDYVASPCGMGELISIGASRIFECGGTHYIAEAKKVVKHRK